MRKKSKYIPSSQASIRRGTGNLFTWNVQEPQNEVMQFGNWIVSQQAANIRRQRVLDTTLTGGLGIWPCRVFTERNRNDNNRNIKSIDPPPKKNRKKKSIKLDLMTTWSIFHSDYNPLEEH